MKKILSHLIILATSMISLSSYAQKADWERLNISSTPNEYYVKSFIMLHLGSDDYVGILTKNYNAKDNEILYRKKIMKASDCSSDDGQGTLYSLGKKDTIEDKDSVSIKNLALFENSLSSMQAKIICKKYADFIVQHTESDSDMRTINNYQMIPESMSFFNDYLGSTHVTLKTKLIDNSTYEIYVEKFSVKKEDCDKKKGILQRFSLDLKDQGMYHFDMRDKAKDNLSEMVVQICSQYEKLSKDTQ